MVDSLTPTSSSLQQEEPYNFSPLRNSIFGWIEFLIVFLIGLGIILIMVCFIASTIFGFWGQQYKNILQGIPELESHWKMGLLILIPLFFRPIFKFLMNLKEGPFGSKTNLAGKPGEGPQGYNSQYSKK